MVISTPTSENESAYLRRRAVPARSMHAGSKSRPVGAGGPKLSRCRLARKAALSAGRVTQRHREAFARRVGSCAARESLWNCDRVATRCSYLVGVLLQP